MRSSSSSSRHRTENNRGISCHMLTLHQRLYQALNLGSSKNFPSYKRFIQRKPLETLIRSNLSYDDKKKKWHCTDVEMQRHAIRSISAFLDCVSSETSNHPLVKDSVADMVAALEGIVQYKNGTVSAIAAKVALQLVSTLPSSIQEFHVLDLVQPLSWLLSTHQVEAAVYCATCLNVILSNLSTKREKEVWEILKETDTVSHIVTNLHNFLHGSKTIEYFEQMASLLSTILSRWPPSRRRVWSDTKLMEVLEAVYVKPDFCVEVEVLKLYSALALCGYGSKKLLERESLLQVIVHCMDSSHSHAVRMAGLKLAQHLARSESGCLKVMSLCGEAIVGSIIGEMSRRTLRLGRIPSHEMSLLVEACRMALIITRWGGGHHISFWKLGIDRVLLDLLLADRHKMQQSQHLPMKEQISAVQEALKDNMFLVLRPYIWEILGWLAAHCEDDFHPDVHGDEFSISILITCACSAFVNSIHEGRQIRQNDITHTFSSEAASRAVLMMTYSHCKYIASKARFVLSEILKPHGKEYLKYLLANLNFTLSREKFGMSDLRQTSMNVMALTCYSSLPQYRKHVIKHEGLKTLVAVMRGCLSNQVRVGRRNFNAHLYNTFGERTCCWVSNDWEGEDFLLLCSLWGLAELIRHSTFVKNKQNIFSSQIDYGEAQLINELQEICTDTSTPGPRWYAAYILSFFGIYGFPSTFGRRIGKALDEKEYADLELILSNGESLCVHGVFLMVRCPALLPPEKVPGNQRARDNTAPQEDTVNLCNKFRKEARLSSHVDHQDLVKLLEFVYLGYLQAEEELVKKLKTFAKRCNLQPLLQMLCRKRPKWGTPFPSCDLSLALNCAVDHISDIILEAKATELTCWTCNVCSLLVPHVHAHKVILWASSDHLQALFRSGMLESQSHIIKVPISWEALVKLVDWFYSDELPKPPSGCLWDNMNGEEKLQELLPYIELCWLADFWFLGDIQEDCSRVIVSCMNSARHLSVKIIQIAAEFSQWKLAEVAANNMAPIYRQLQDSGELEKLDEELVELVRTASVRLSQEVGKRCSS